MAIRLPLKQVLDNNTDTENGAGVAGDNASTAGVAAYDFTLPQDTSNVVVKFTASIAGAGASVTLQTSDDGGTTWYDVARSSVISNAVDENAEWVTGSTTAPGIGSRVYGQNSVAGATNEAVQLNGIGEAAASALGQSETSGLPILGLVGRAAVIYSAGITSIINERIRVYANDQSPSA